jgi:hypothetical protein
MSNSDELAAIHARAVTVSAARRGLAAVRGGARRCAAVRGGGTGPRG